MSELPRRSLESWLDLAYGERSTCPSPETLHRAELGELTSGELGELEWHVGCCPACAAEQHVAKLFEASTAEIATLGEPIDRIVRELERRSPVRQVDREETAQSGGWLRLPWRILQPGPAWALAAAALVVVAGITFEQMRPAPPLPPAGDSTVRGAHVEGLAPAGDIEAPMSLSWETAEGAASYRVTLAEVDATILWESVVPGAGAALPDQIRQRLRPMVAYLWRVEALDEQGTRVAWSDWVRFRVTARDGPPQSSTARVPGE